MPSVDHWYMTANFDVEPFGDPQVREALSYAIDRAAITQAARFDAASVNQTAIPETSFWYYDYAPYSHDPDRARQLLDDAGGSDLSMGSTGRARATTTPSCSDGWATSTPSASTTHSTSATYNPDVVQAWLPGLSGFVARPDKAINFETVQLSG